MTTMNCLPCDIRCSALGPTTCQATVAPSSPSARCESVELTDICKSPCALRTGVEDQCSSTAFLPEIVMRYWRSITIPLTSTGGSRSCVDRMVPDMTTGFVSVSSDFASGTMQGAQESAKAERATALKVRPADWLTSIASSGPL